MLEEENSLRKEENLDLLESIVEKNKNSKAQHYNLSQKDREKHGQETYTYSDGSSYVGEWKNDKRDGQGTYISSDGSSYVGEWKNDKMHGQGTYTLRQGGSVDGVWKNGKKIS